MKLIPFLMNHLGNAFGFGTRRVYKRDRSGCARANSGENEFEPEGFGTGSGRKRKGNEANAHDGGNGTDAGQQSGEQAGSDSSHEFGKRPGQGAGLCRNPGLVTEAIRIAF